MKKRPEDYSRFFAMSDMPEEIKPRVCVTGTFNSLDFHKLLQVWDDACNGGPWVWGSSPCVQAIAEAYCVTVNTLEGGAGDFS